MQHIVAVAERQSAQQLIHEALHHVQVDVAVQTVEILFQILIAMLEHESEFLVRMKNVVETDDIFVF